MKAPNQIWSVIRALTACQTKAIIVFLIWLFAIMAAISALFIIFANGDLKHSLWENGYNGAGVFFPLALALGAASQHLRIFVAHGVTRRNFSIGFMISLIGIAAVTSAGETLGFGLENLLYRIPHWVDAMQAPHLFTSSGQLPAIFGESMLLVFGGMSSGWLIGCGFNRFGFLGGLLFILPGLAPAAASQLLPRISWLGSAADGLRISRMSTTLAISLAVLIILLGLLTAAAMTSRMSVAGNPNRNFTPQWSMK